MSISRTRFVIIFVFSAFVFMFVSNALFGTSAQVFPQPPESFLGTRPPVAWKSVGYTILLPLKLVLVAPLLPFPDFLRDDPPPPFVAAVFILYWSVLALVVHALIKALKRTSPIQQ